MKPEKKKKERIDVLLVERGVFETREKARRHIMAGLILVDDRIVDKPGTRIPETAQIRIKGTVMPYVGRGGYKLERAIKEFRLDLRDVIMADIGASTGGFTDCALQNGAKKVYAIDVGTNQLDWKLRSDVRVVNLEKTNIKDVTVENIGEQVDFVATDISFISVCRIIPACKSILKNDGSIVILIKPQFEAGREKVDKGGIVKNPAVHEEVIVRTLETFRDATFHTHGLTWSPIKGGKGNIEFLAYLKKEPFMDRRFEIEENIKKIINEAHVALEV